MSTPDAAPWCGAISQPGTPVTAYARGPVLVMARPDLWFACTQDVDHERCHAACDGQGRILARWPRKAGERYWRPGEDAAAITAALTGPEAAR